MTVERGALPAAGDHVVQSAGSIEARPTRHRGSVCGDADRLSRGVECGVSTNSEHSELRAHGSPINRQQCCGARNLSSRSPATPAHRHPTTRRAPQRSSLRWTAALVAVVEELRFEVEHVLPSIGADPDGKQHRIRIRLSSFGRSHEVRF